MKWNFAAVILKNFLYFPIFREKNPPQKIYIYIYISGNGNPKKLLILQEIKLLGRSLNNKKIYPQKNSLYLRKWNLLTLRLKNLLYFLKKNLFYISGNRTLYFSAQAQKIRKIHPEKIHHNLILKFFLYFLKRKLFLYFGK